MRFLSKKIFPIILTAILLMWLGGAFLSQAHMEIPSCHAEVMVNVCPVIQYAFSLWQQVGFSAISLALLISSIIGLWKYFRKQLVSRIQFYWLRKIICCRWSNFYPRNYLIDFYSSGVACPQLYQ